MDGQRASAYDRALTRFERFTARDRDHVADEGRTLLFVHGRTTARATIFLHGLTASPRQFIALAEHVHRSGENVLVPRLPLHGHRDRGTDALRDLRADELTACVAEALAIARDLGTAVRVVGFSLGGTLAVWTALEHDVAHAIAIAPLFGIAGVPQRFTQSVARTARRLPNRFVWWNPLLRARLMPSHGYPRYATHAIAEALFLAHDIDAQAQARGLRSRLTIVTNAGETGVSNSAIRRRSRSWRPKPGSEIALHRLRGLRFSHDIIEPLRDPAIITRSYPQLVAILDADDVRGETSAETLGR